MLKLEQFLIDFYKEKTGYFFVGTKSKIFSQRFFSTKKITDAVVFISKIAKSCNVYLSLNTFQTPQRAKHNVVLPISHVLLDLDKVEKMQDFTNDFKNKHTLIQTSSNRYQALINVSISSVEKAEVVARGLARKYNADYTHDVTRFFRCPWTYNRKYAPPFFVKILNFQVEKLYLEEIRKLEIDDKKLSSHFVLNIPQDADMLPLSDNDIEHAKALYSKILTHTPTKPTGEKDYSVADFRFVLHLLEKEAIQDAKTISAMLFHVSPNLFERKGKHMRDYIRRTVANAIKIRESNT